MKSGFHSAITITADLQTDVAASAHTGSKTLGLRVAKIDGFPLTNFLLMIFAHISSGLAMIAPVPSRVFAWNLMYLAVKARKTTIKTLSPYFALIVEE